MYKATKEEQFAGSGGCGRKSGQEVRTPCRPWVDRRPRLLLWWWRGLGLRLSGGRLLLRWQLSVDCEARPLEEGGGGVGGGSRREKARPSFGRRRETARASLGRRRERAWASLGRHREKDRGSLGRHREKARASLGCRCEREEEEEEEERRP
jgi:hypothetical protein